MYPGSVVSMDSIFGTPPFENPNIVKALMNFNMYKFGHDGLVSLLFNKVNILKLLLLLK